ncbi:hypothetical protein QM574_16520 [Pantoea ananatis]|uniref:hypothetical protein n=1 Tax=Pantoea ananas TaxID=553 RepID=UPI0024B740AF|nr:hypothetical protein [Pantoea ananatis]MDJ0046159.1 hypothetical protein [Pantoea ananatis]
MKDKIMTVPSLDLVFEINNLISTHFRKHLRMKMIEIKDTISFGGFIINIVTMVIAIASSLISYLVYKENSSPDVIVYLEQDEHALIILNVVIKNIGKSAARDVSFKSSRPLFEKAYKAEQHQLIDQGPLITGIPFLAPNASRVLAIGSYAGLSELLRNEKIEIETSFYKANSALLYSRKIKNVSYLEVYSFAGISASDNSNEKKIENALTRIEKAILSKK